MKGTIGIILLGIGLAGALAVDAIATRASPVWYPGVIGFMCLALAGLVLFWLRRKKPGPPPGPGA